MMTTLCGSGNGWMYGNYMHTHAMWIEGGGTGGGAIHE
jgi:hypothetical protein